MQMDGQLLAEPSDEREIGMSGPAAMYEAYLREEGYVPRIDGDGDVVFKMEGTTYFIDVDEDDAAYFRVVCPNFWPIDDEAERARAFAACSRTSAQVKVTKVHLEQDNTWASVELFLADPKDFEQVFPRAMRSLRHGLQVFVDDMRSQLSDGEAEA